MTAKQKIVPILVFLVTVRYVMVLSYYVVPDLGDKVYVKEGDINIGVIFAITDFDPLRHCSDKVSAFQPIEMIESIVFAVNSINKSKLNTCSLSPSNALNNCGGHVDVKFHMELEKQIFPNLTLGFVITDTCHKETIAAVQALRFTPNSNVGDYIKPNKSNHLQSFKVVGVIGTDLSSTSMSAAQVLNTGNLALLTFWAFDSRLSDFSYYPNFFSVSAPELYLLHAAFRFFAYKQWYYVNLVHDDSPMAESLLTELKKIHRFNNFCLSIRARVTEKTNLTKMINYFIGNDTASKIMFVIAGTSVIERISKAVMSMGAEGKLLWIGLEKWTDYMNSPNAILGSLGLHFFSPIVTGLSEHLRLLDDRTPNPWLKSMFHDTYGCEDTVCIRKHMRELHSEPTVIASLTYTATMVYVQAIAKHLRKHCPNYTPSDAQDCLLQNLDTLPVSLRNVTIPGYEHNARINERGFVLESFMVYQKPFNEESMLRPVVRIGINDNDLVKISEIEWLNYQIRFEILNPNHYCMPTCAYNEYQYTISKCCWACRRCQDNERVSDEHKICEMCPVLYWPTQVNDYSVCLFIPPNYYSWKEPVPALLIGLAMVGVATCLIVLFLYVRNRKHPVIRASSLELSFVQLASCILGYFAVPIFLMKPTDIACKIAIFVFRFSCNILFLTMLIKAVRVYRIFKLSKKNKKLSFTGTRFILLICCLHFVLEASELYITNIFYPLTVETTQPEIKVNYTELSCKFEKAHLLPFFVFDFFLLIMCSLFAFKTQTLPKNFRESRFVSMCIITSLILWIAFMPAYMTLISNNAKTLLLVCAILINQTNLIIFIFITRLVAWNYTASNRKSIFLTTLS